MTVYIVNYMIADCSNITNDGTGSGVFQLSPKASEPFEAFCVFDQDGKWTVIQQRFNGNTDFNRGWTSYKHGFGSIETHGNFW